MFEELNAFFVLSPAKTAAERLSEDTSEETKKCKRCLRRVDVSYVTCPYCKSGEFHFDNG